MTSKTFSKKIIKFSSETNLYTGTRLNVNSEVSLSMKLKILCFSIVGLLICFNANAIKKSVSKKEIKNTDIYKELQKAVSNFSDS